VLIKTKWIVIGLVAPEMVLYLAWEQFAAAKKLTMTINKVIAKQVKEDFVTHKSFHLIFG
jgi:hypothetical protein